MDTTTILSYVAALAVYTVAGMLWYGPLFGNYFIALAYPGMTKDDLRKLSPPTGGYLMSHIAALTSNFAVRSIAAAFEATTVAEIIPVRLPPVPAKTALIPPPRAQITALLTAFFSTNFLIPPFFEDRPIMLSVLHVGYKAICFSALSLLYLATL